MVTAIVLFGHLAPTFASAQTQSFPWTPVESTPVQTSTPESRDQVKAQGEIPLPQAIAPTTEREKRAKSYVKEFDATRVDDKARNEFHKQLLERRTDGDGERSPGDPMCGQRNQVVVSPADRLLQIRLFQQIFENDLANDNLNRELEAKRQELQRRADQLFADEIALARKIQVTNQTNLSQLQRLERERELQLLQRNRSRRIGDLNSGLDRNRVGRNSTETNANRNRINVQVARESTRRSEKLNLTTEQKRLANQQRERQRNRAEIARNREVQRRQTEQLARRNTQQRQQRAQSQQRAQEQQRAQIRARQLRAMADQRASRRAIAEQNRRNYSKK